jgi:quercetin dioxygenase-like cupin family protein
MDHVVAHSKDSFTWDRESEHFHGVVLREELSERSTPVGLHCSFVRFKKGAFTKLHHHTGGQVLYVTHGEGFVEFSDGAVYDLRPGTRVVIPPGELHRHGATLHDELEHLVVTAGETVWWDADPTQAGPR